MSIAPLVAVATGDAARVPVAARTAMAVPLGVAAPTGVADVATVVAARAGASVGIGVG